MSGVARMFELGWNGVVGCYDSPMQPRYVAPSALVLCWVLLPGACAPGWDMSPLWGWALRPFGDSVCVLKVGIRFCSNADLGHPPIVGARLGLNLTEWNPGAQSRMSTPDLGS